MGGKRRGLVVDGYSERWLRRGFPWVYPKEVEAGAGAAGRQVLVRSRSGEVLGRALTDEGWIAARVYRHDGGPLDQAWLSGVLDRAADLREELIDDRTTGYRLVHAENDGLPGIRVDWWGHHAVVILDSPAVHSLVGGVVAWLEARRSPRGVYLCYRRDPRDDRDPAGFSPAPGLVDGHEARDEVRVTERGVAFLVRPGDGPDVGLYPDMREVRAWMEPHWGGRSVLNTFAYTGAFSVHAALGGATEVVTLDLSEQALDRAEANFSANGLDPADWEFVQGDTFKGLDRFRRSGRRFDRVVLDPPAFSRGPGGVWSAKRDYPRLVAAAARVLAPRGWILAASNQGEVAPKAFRGHVAEGLKRAGRVGQELHWAREAADFPAGTWFPEARYLKVGVWRVLQR